MTNNYTIYHSGLKNESRNGVAIAIKNKLTNCVAEYKAINNHIMILKLRATPCDINILQVYAPTMDAEETDTDNFCARLEETVSKNSSKDIVIIMGDFNVKVGNEVADDHLFGVKGKYSLGKRNQNGEQLFCIDNGYFIMNIMFKHRVRRLFTWILPDSITRYVPNWLYSDVITMEELYRECENLTGSRL